MKYFINYFLRKEGIELINKGIIDEKEFNNLLYHFHGESNYL